MVKPATGLIAWYMRTFGFEGWTSLWGDIYLLPGGTPVVQLLRHELCHQKQMERDGKLLFMLKYMWRLLWYGYYQNPYEVEARAQEIDRNLNQNT